MATKLCGRFGIVAGGSVGLLVGLLHGLVCCGSSPVPPTIGQLSLDGLIVSLIFVFLAAAFVCLVKHLPLTPVFTLALLIGIVVGVLMGPLAYHIPNPGLSLIVCAILGALVGRLICRILCGMRGINWGTSR
jgi:xanthosine utilization system XapX-like protein